MHASALPYPKQFKRPPVRTARSSAGTLTLIGRTYTIGTYVLRMRVAKSLGIDFRPKEGRTTVRFEPGDYCYVGSAHAGLAHRVLRHATRSGDRPPHPIRGLMLTEFRRAGLGTRVRPPRTKRLGVWNVDYLLDRPEVDLGAAFLIRWPKKLEQYVGGRIAGDPRAIVVETGLGGGDYDALTLLLRINAGEAWWRRLPAQLARWALAAALDRLYHPLVDELIDDGRLSDKQMVTVLNMRGERATDLLRLMTRGVAFSRAEKASRGKFDTHDCAEIVNRLARGHGSVCKALAVLRGQQRRLIAADPQRQEVVAWAKELKAAVGRLRRVLSRACPPGRRPARPDPNAPARAGVNQSSHPSFRQVVGQLKQCAYFLDKSARDLPIACAKDHAVPTQAEGDRIRGYLTRIAADGEALLRICAEDARASGRPPRTPG